MERIEELKAQCDRIISGYDELLDDALTEIHQRGPSHPLADVLVKPQPKSMGRIGGFEI